MFISALQVINYQLKVFVELWHLTHEHRVHVCKHSYYLVLNST